MPFCTACSAKVEKKYWIGHLRSNAHKNNCSLPLQDGVSKITSAFRNRIASYKIIALDKSVHYLPEVFLNHISSKVHHLIQVSLKVHVSIKINFELYCQFLMFKNDRQEIKSFATKNETIHQNYNFTELFSKVVSNIKKKIDQFEQRDSGWAFLNNSHFEVNINKYDPLYGARFIELPKLIQTKKACINIRNKDSYCFLWCVVAALCPVKKNCDRVSSYPHFSEILDITGMSFPVTFTDISTFENNNKRLSINVYGLKNHRSVVGPLYRSQYKREVRINLLLLESDKYSHYCLIKNLPRLVRSQVTKHHGKLFFCEDCLLFFNTEDSLNNHICSGVMTILPEKGTYMEFKNFIRKQDVPFVVYADFETYLSPYQSCEPNPNDAYSMNRQIHVPIAFAYYVVCSFDNSLNHFVEYRGVDCVQRFIKSIYLDVKTIYDVLNKNVPMIFNDEDAKAYSQASHCHICQQLLFFDRVKDHCHLTGIFRGAAHQICNLQFKVPKLIPIFFHNLSGYDCHLFIKELGENEGPIKIIPKNKENYISFTKFLHILDGEYAQIRFVDSFKFLGTSLERLARGLQLSDFVYLKHFFPADKQFQLLTRKGIYPYDHMNSLKSFEETRLPSKESFFNFLSNEHITDLEYKHAKKIWHVFKIKNMGEYTDLYLKTDVLLLTDIFENFRKICKEHYHLDPAFYLTAPSLSFDAMLLKTGVKLELISDLEIIRMIQSGIRGGICLCSNRYAKANNKYMTKHDPSKSSSYITYIDCNNLYGYSMCQALPISDFRLLDSREIESLDIMNISNDAKYGYILEVDLEYSDKLHSFHNDYPFCAENFVAPGGKTSKLIPNLYDKYRYVIHYVYLKTCLKHGLILKKIHRGIVFRQSNFLQEYIDLNTELRKQAVTQFQQDLFKLNNNSIFGKTLENSERRVDVRLVNQWNVKNNKTKKANCANKLIARPNFHSATVFSENLVAIQMKPERFILDKPIYIGFAVLELSKSHMYDFHYSVIKPHYGNKVKLCYTDTDSFIYTIQTEDFYDDLNNRFSMYFDTSNFKDDNPFNIRLKNKKVPGLFKDELGGQIITEFVGLRSKLYCIKTETETIKKAKGVKKCVVRDLTASDYHDVLLSGKVVRKKNILFKSIKHEIFTRTVNKIALSNNDDKRFITSDKISTKAWGHKSIL